MRDRNLPPTLRFAKRKTLVMRKASASFTRHPKVTEQSTEPLDQVQLLTATRHCCSVPAGLLSQRAWFTAAALFLLILSGPPKLRIRDPRDSLRGEIDWVVILHIVVWTLAGFWVLLQMGRRFYARQPVLRLRLPQIFGLAMILCLSVSILKSAAPALTAFKVYQMLVSLLFTHLFVSRFGVRASLKMILWGNAFLCIAIAVCAFLAPGMVWTPSDFSWEAVRLRGDLVASTGAVSVLAIILMLTIVRRVWRVLPLLLLVFFCGLLALSLTRTAYAALVVFFILALLRPSTPKRSGRFVYLTCAAALALCAYHWLPSLSEYRDPETVTSLSDRIGLWRHLTNVTLKQSPWFGLGYYSASRIHGLEYNAGLGTAHSIFFEVLSGGGLPSLVFLAALCLTLSVYAVRLLCAAKDRSSFAVSALFIACLMLGSMGSDVDSGPVAISFWCAAAILPQLYQLLLKQTAQRTEPGHYLVGAALRRV